MKKKIRFINKSQNLDDDEEEIEENQNRIHQTMFEGAQKLHKKHILNTLIAIQKKRVTSTLCSSIGGKESQVLLNTVDGDKKLNNFVKTSL